MRSINCRFIRFYAWIVIEICFVFEFCALRLKARYTHTHTNIRPLQQQSEFWFLPWLWFVFNFSAISIWSSVSLLIYSSNLCFCFSPVAEFRIFFQLLATHTDPPHTSTESENAKCYRNPFGLTNIQKHTKMVNNLHFEIIMDSKRSIHHPMKYEIDRGGGGAGGGKNGQQQPSTISHYWQNVFEINQTSTIEWLELTFFCVCFFVQMEWLHINLSGHSLHQSADEKCIRQMCHTHTHMCTFASVHSMPRTNLFEIFDWLMCVCVCLKENGKKWATENWKINGQRQTNIGCKHNFIQSEVLCSLKPCCWHFANGRWSPSNRFQNGI